MSGNKHSEWTTEFRYNCNYMIYDLLKAFSFFMAAPLAMVALPTSQIYLMIYLKLHTL